MSYVCWVQNSLQSVNTGEDTLALSGDTAPGGGGQSRRVWLVEAGPVHPCDGPARVQGQAQVHQDHRENCHQCNVKC